MRADGCRVIDEEDDFSFNDHWFRHGKWKADDRVCPEC
jgi:hypothetical protein